MSSPEAQPPLFVVPEGLGSEEKIYTSRFTEGEELSRKVTWEVLCEKFLPRYIKNTDVVLDIGAGDGHFIKNINAKRKIAVDLSAHAEKLREFGIEVLKIPATKITQHFTEKVDVVFMSNFLEHLPHKGTVIEVLEQAKAVLRPGGKVIIFQPNIRFIGAAYWDYIDHQIALTEYSLVEALEVSGFEVKELIPQLLPYTAKSKMGKLISKCPTRLVVSLYLSLPILWKIFGKQTFVVAESLSK